MTNRVHFLGWLHIPPVPVFCSAMHDPDGHYFARIHNNCRVTCRNSMSSTHTFITPISTTLLFTFLLNASFIQVFRRVRKIPKMTVSFLMCLSISQSVRPPASTNSVDGFSWNLISEYCSRPPLWSSGQSFWLQIQRSRVRFPALPDFLSSIGSGTGSTQPREVNWATWIKSSGSGPENRD